MKEQKLLTLKEARESIRMEGLSVSNWAINNGFKPQTVKSVLYGSRGYNIGQSHNIAVVLGIKEGKAID